MDEQWKYAILFALFAATLLSARKLMDRFCAQPVLAIVSFCPKASTAVIAIGIDTEETRITSPKQKLQT